MKTVYKDIFDSKGRHLTQIQIDILADGQFVGWFPDREMTDDELIMWLNILDRETIVAEAGFFQEDYLRIAKREREYRQMDDLDPKGAA